MIPSSWREIYGGLAGKKLMMYGSGQRLPEQFCWVWLHLVGNQRPIQHAWCMSNNKGILIYFLFLYEKYFIQLFIY